jgi:anthranilate synthase/aminodeoxychorismate synthase-like glutamine amidotransferase
VLFVDNFDSFSFNLVDELRRRGAEVAVWRNDVPAARLLELAEALPAPRLIVLSPGPGHPKDAGSCVELIRLARGKVPVLGVCLGHQALVEALGGTVGGAGEIFHGKTGRVTHDGEGLFRGLPDPLTVGRYHSLVATEVPDGLTVRARCGDLVMAVEGKEEKLAGLQFHPESILTPQGGRLLENALAWAKESA